MADLVVHPSIVVGPEDIITADVLNLLATPVVDLALAEPVNDQNFFRNGNFYSSYWTTPAGMSCPVNVETSNANYWYTKPQGAAVTTKRATLVPDTNSLFSHEIDGAVGVTSVEFGQHIGADLSATLRRICTFSGNIYNNSGLILSPKLEIYSCNVFNNFTATTLQTTVDLQTCSNGVWTFVSATLDLSPLTNIANGIIVAVLLPSGTLSSVGKIVYFSRIKFQIGEVATEFTDDVSLFVTSPSVDSTMLQDGCIARPSLFLPHVVPSGAYVAKSIQDGDIADNTITARAIASGAITGALGYTPINKAGDTAIGPGILDFVNDDPVGATAHTTAALRVSTTTTNAANDGYIPAISFNRPGGKARALGLAVDSRFRTVDQAGTIGYLLDSVTKVDAASYQDASISYAKLAQSCINLLMPVGTIVLFGGTSPPTGWFKCDGSWINRVANSALFAVIGVTWGAADGSVNFALPDFRGRVPIGYAPSPPAGITARGFASLGGEETHVLGSNELATHFHSITDQQHNHSDSGHTHGIINATGGLSAQPGSGMYSAAGGTNTNVGNAAIQPSFSNINHTENSGNSVAHNNMQPFAVCFYIIKG